MSFDIDKFLECAFKRKTVDEADFVNLCEYVCYSFEFRCESGFLLSLDCRIAS